MKNLGKIKQIKEIEGMELGNKSDLYGKDGYLVETDKHTWHLLIDNGQSCCESWGYLWSDEDLSKYVGKELIGVKITDKALNTRMIEAEKDIYEGGIQFVDFKFGDGDVLQFAVYNEHNGYYGHDILIAKDNKILLSEVL